MNKAMIKGMGWVLKSSMGWPGHVRYSQASKQLPTLSGKSVLGSPYKPFGRMDNFSRLGFSAIFFAMSQAGIDSAPEGDNPIPIIAGSRTGCLETDLVYQKGLSHGKEILPSPAVFAYTLPSCFLGEASIYYGLTGETLMIEKSINPGLTSLAMAMDILESGNGSTVICGTCNSDLQYPAIGRSSEPITGGAVFLVLEKYAPTSESSKPIITKEINTQLFFCRDKQITTLMDLIPAVVSAVVSAEIPIETDPNRPIRKNI